MTVYITQMYTEPGEDYPFSHLWQGRLSDEITKYIKPSKKFCRLYGNDFDLDLYVDANSSLASPQVSGPIALKKDKSVEYIITLTFDRNADPKIPKSFVNVLKEVFEAVCNVLDDLEIDTNSLNNAIPALIDKIVEDKSMFIV
jgi:hypothetical protein